MKNKIPVLMSLFLFEVVILSFISLFGRLGTISVALSVSIPVTLIFLIYYFFKWINQIATDPDQTNLL